MQALLFCEFQLQVVNIFFMFRWARIGEDLDLLDAPGILPMKLRDQAAAVRLAICHDIGESSYAVAGVAAVFVEILKRLPTAGKLLHMFVQFMVAFTV